MECESQRTTDESKQATLCDLCSPGLSCSSVSDRASRWPIDHVSAVAECCDSSVTVTAKFLVLGEEGRERGLLDVVAAAGCDAGCGDRGEGEYGGDSEWVGGVEGLEV